MTQRPLLALIGFLLFGITAATQQPAAPAATGEVVGSRSYSPMVADVDATAANYKALGMDLPAPGIPYPWNMEPWHYDLHGAQAPKSPMRFFTATLQGGADGATPLLIEPVEHKDIARTTVRGRVQDPGVATLVLLVRDVDAALARARAGGLTVVTTGGAPVAVPGYGGRSRSVTMRNADGHFFELLQLDPLPPTTAPAASPILGARLRVTVIDMARTLALYRDAFKLPFRDPLTSPDGVAALIGAPGAKVTLRATTFPRSNQVLEFLEVSGVDRKAVTPKIQDPGATRFQLTVRSVDNTIALFKAAGPMTVVSTGGVPIDRGNSKVAVLSDLNGLYLVVTGK